MVGEAAPQAIGEADKGALDGAPEATLLPSVEHPTEEPLEALVDDVVDGEHELDEANVAAERLRDVVPEALPQATDKRVVEAPCLEEAGDPVHDLDRLDEVQQVRQEEGPADGTAERPQDAGEEEPEESTLGEDLREAAAKEGAEPLECHPDALPKEGESPPDEPESGAGRELEREATDGGGDAAKDSGEDSAPADELLLTLGEGSVPVGELAGSLEDPGADIENDAAQGAKVVDEVPDELLEVLVAEQVAERLGEVLDLRRDVLDELLELGARALDEVGQPRMELVSRAGEEQEHVIEGGAPGLGCGADNPQQGADLLGHRAEARPDLLDEVGDAGDERAEAAPELVAVEAVEDVGEGVRHRAGQVLDGVADHAPEVLERLLDLDLEARELVEGAADLLQRLHEAIAVLQDEGCVSDGAHGRLELGEPGPAGGRESVPDALEDLACGDGDGSELTECRHSLADPVVDVLVVPLDPLVEVLHGVGEPGAEVGEDLRASTEETHQRGAEALPALARVPRALDGVLEELLEGLERGRGLGALSEGRHGVAPGGGPVRDVGVEQRDGGLVQLADRAGGLLPDAAGDDLPELLVVVDDLGEDILEVRDGSADDEDRADQAGDHGGPGQGQLGDLCHVID